MNCNNCNQKKDPWEHCYTESYKCFQAALRRSNAITAFFFIATIVSLIIGLFIVYNCFKNYAQFVAQFEYVEETQYQITQEDGINTAVIGDENEVKTNGQPNSNCRSDN